MQCCYPHSMIPGPENFSDSCDKSRAAAGARPSAGCGDEEDRAVLRVYSRTRQGPAWEGRPRPLCSAYRGPAPQAVPSWEPPGLRLGFSVEQQLLFPPAPLPLGVSVSSSVRKQHNGAPRDLLERMRWRVRVKCLHGAGHKGELCEQELFLSLAGALPSF